MIRVGIGGCCWVAGQRTTRAARPHASTSIMSVRNRNRTSYLMVMPSLSRHRSLLSIGVLLAMLTELARVGIDQAAGF